MVFVGDIHGCIDEFDSLLEKVRFDRQQDSLVLVGDLVNKGYDSIAVVKRAMELGAHCVLGNPTTWC
jgi:Icc-related predicted phosphoesterase